MNLINGIRPMRKIMSIRWLNSVLTIFKGGVYMTEEEEKELNQMLARIEKQHDTLRKSNGEKDQYKHLEKTDVIKVHTNDKQAMKFWEE